MSETGLRKRLITVLTFKEGVLFRTKLFQPDYRYTANFVDAWSIDEVIALDITPWVPGAAASRREPFFDVLGQFARRCFVPLTGGGGIRSVGDVSAFLGAGADKVAINSGAIETPQLIEAIATRYGSQCVILSMDVKRHGDGRYEVFGRHGAQPTGRDAVAWAQQAEALGAGEILLTAIDRDGSLEGFDLELCRRVTEAVRIPVLVLGGGGNWQHFEAAFGSGVSGVCTQNIYHFTESSIRSAKSYLKKTGTLVRH